MEMHRLKGWENICHANTNQKKYGEAILLLVKVDFIARDIARDKNTIFQNEIRVK